MFPPRIFTSKFIVSGFDTTQRFSKRIFVPPGKYKSTKRLSIFMNVFCSEIESIKVAVFRISQEKVRKLLSNRCTNDPLRDWALPEYIITIPILINLECQKCTAIFMVNILGEERFYQPLLRSKIRKSLSPSPWLHRGIPQQELSTPQKRLTALIIRKHVVIIYWTKYLYDVN